MLDIQMDHNMATSPLIPVAASLASRLPWGALKWGLRSESKQGTAHGSRRPGRPPAVQGPQSALKYFTYEYTGLLAGFV